MCVIHSAFLTLFSDSDFWRLNKLQAIWKKLAAISSYRQFIARYRPTAREIAKNFLKKLLTFFGAENRRLKKAGYIAPCITGITKK